MLERLLRRLLLDGISRLSEDTSRLVTYFAAQNRLEADEVNRLREVFERTPPAVYQQLARTDVKFPCYTIHLSGEAEHIPGTFLGDFAGVLSQEQAEALGNLTLEGGEHLGSFYMKDYQIIAHSPHPDTTIALYELSKYFIQRGKGLLSDQGVLNTKLSGGDMAPLSNEQWGPDYIFRRRLSVQLIELHEVVGDLLPPIRTIDGLRVSVGSTISANGVKTLVTSNGFDE